MFRLASNATKEWIVQLLVLVMWLPQTNALQVATVHAVKTRSPVLRELTAQRDRLTSTNARWEHTETPLEQLRQVIAWMLRQISTAEEEDLQQLSASHVVTDLNAMQKLCQLSLQTLKEENCAPSAIIAQAKRLSLWLVRKAHTSQTQVVLSASTAQQVTSALVELMYHLRLTQILIAQSVTTALLSRTL